MPKPPKKTINIDEEVYRFVDMVSRNIMTIKDIEKLIKDKSKGWGKPEKNLFRKIVIDILRQFIINNFNPK